MRKENKEERERKKIYARAAFRKNQPLAGVSSVAFELDFPSSGSSTRHDEALPRAAIREERHAEVAATAERRTTMNVNDLRQRPFFFLALSSPKRHGEETERSSSLVHNELHLFFFSRSRCSSSSPLLLVATRESPREEEARRKTTQKKEKKRRRRSTRWRRQRFFFLSACFFFSPNSSLFFRSLSLY